MSRAPTPNELYRPFMQGTVAVAWKHHKLQLRLLHSRELDELLFPQNNLIVEGLTREQDTRSRGYSDFLPVRTDNQFLRRASESGQSDVGRTRTGCLIAPARAQIPSRCSSTSSLSSMPNPLVVPAWRPSLSSSIPTQLAYHQTAPHGPRMVTQSPGIKWSKTSKMTRHPGRTLRY